MDQQLLLQPQQPAGLASEAARQYIEFNAPWTTLPAAQKDDDAALIYIPKSLTEVLRSEPWPWT